MNPLRVSLDQSPRAVGVTGDLTMAAARRDLAGEANGPPDIFQIFNDSGFLGPPGKRKRTSICVSGGCSRS